MRGLAVGITGALVLVACVAALMEIDGRAGPIEAALEPVSQDVQITGTTLLRAAQPGPGGLCLEPPCDARTTIDLTLVGFPDMPLSARLVGDEVLMLQVRATGEGHRITFDAGQDHTDKDRVVLSMLDREVATLPVAAGQRSIETTVQVGWDVPSMSVRLTEIGGVEISTRADGVLDATPPAGWRFEARLEGDGIIELGPLETDGPGSLLASRVERVALEDQDRMIIDLVGPGGRIAVLAGSL